jgi:hypothetical protein
MIDPIHNIPKNRKRNNAFKLCLGIAFAVLMLLAVAPQITAVMTAF